LNIKANDDEVNNIISDKFEKDIETDMKRNQYEQDKDFIWSATATTKCHDLPPLPPLKSYTHDEETKLERKEKKKQVSISSLLYLHYYHIIMIPLTSL
jgi:hypothetical protein